MIRDVTREDDTYISLTEADHAKLKPGESFIRLGDKIFIERRSIAKRILSDSHHRIFKKNFSAKDGTFHEVLCTIGKNGLIRVRELVTSSIVTRHPYQGGKKLRLRGRWKEFSGSDVFELLAHLANPEAYKSDWMLLRAKRCAKKAGASHLSNADLRSIAWFAFIPNVAGAKSNDDARSKLHQAIFRPGNHLSSLFFDVWLREPDAVAKLILALRGSEAHPQTAQTEADFLESARCGKLPPELKATAAARERVKQARQLTKPPGDILALAQKLQRKKNRP
jgi:hypothetical protein